MKNFSVFFFLFMFSHGYSQSDTTKTALDRKHEVKIGAIKLIAGPIFEGTYEYIHSTDFTYGSSILVSLMDSGSYLEDFSVTPFARFYFTERKDYGARGFFVEGFLKYSIGKFDNWVEDYNPETFEYDYKMENYNSGAAGLALGQKWINKSGFVFELTGGIGRTIFGSSAAPDYQFRGDLNIGYRF